eukprot:767491-Hanusia_phi.AAC.3
MSGKAGHPAYYDPQDQKAFMKQPTVFLNKKEFLGKAGRKAARKRRGRKEIGGMEAVVVGRRFAGQWRKGYDWYRGLYEVRKTGVGLQSFADSVSVSQASLQDCQVQRSSGEEIGYCLGQADDEQVITEAAGGKKFSKF